MGYTHYWDHQAFSAKEWGELLEQSRTIISLAIKLPVPLAYEYDQERAPQTDSETIRFNGVGDDGHETFVLTPEAVEFEFCKTASKPYDIAVVAILIAADEIAPHFSWRSDGESEDHEAGRLLAESAKRLTV